MYTINNKQKCTIYNSLLYHDLVDHTIVQDSTDTYIRYSGSSTSNTVSIGYSNIESFVDTSASTGIWCPAIVSDEALVYNKPLFNKQNIRNTILGISSAISFPASFKNWDIQDTNGNTSSASMVTNWYITSIVPTSYAEYGLLFWYKLNKITANSTYLLTNIPDGTLIKSSSSLTYTHTMPSGSSSPPTLVSMTPSIDTTTELIKLNNNTLKIVNKLNNTITGSDISFWSEYDKFYLDRCPSFDIKTNTFSLVNDNVLTKDSKEYSLWISDGEVFSYFDSVINKNKYRSQSYASKTYLSPFLMPVYREIYHTLTLRRPRSITTGLTRNQSSLLQKLCYFLSTFPLIDRTTVNILNSQTIYDAVQTYINSTPASSSDEITSLKSVLATIATEYNNAHLTDGNSKQNLKNNHVHNKAGLVKKLLNKYGAQLFVDNDLSLKYKSKLSNGPHALIGLSTVTMASKDISSDTVLYNNFKLDIGNISYSTEISTTGSAIHLSGSDFSSGGATVPLVDISVTRNSPSPFILTNNPYKEFTAPEIYFTDINLNGDVNATYYWEQVSGPKCLRFTDYNKDSFRVLRYKTSTDYNPDIYIRQAGTYGLRCTRNTDGIIESDEIYVTTDSAFVAPTASAGSSSVNNKIINAIPRRLGFHKHGMAWFADTDHYIKDNYTVRSVSSFDLLNTYRLKDIKIDIPKPSNFTPVASDSDLKLTFLMANGNTKLLIDGINIEHARYKDTTHSQCCSFYEEKIYRDPASPFLSILGSNNFIRDNGMQYNLSYFNNNGELYGKSEILSQPTASTAFAPPILPYGGYNSNKIDAVGIKMPSHNISKPIPILEKRNDIVDPPNIYCFLKEVKQNNCSILRNGFFDPLNGFKLIEGVKSTLAEATIQAIYKGSNNDSGAPNYAASPCPGGHLCNRAKFNIFLNGILVLEANLNNNGGDADNEDNGPVTPPTSDGIGDDILDRYSSTVISNGLSKLIMDSRPDGSIEIEIAPHPSNTNPHGGITWIRIINSQGKIIYSSCLPRGTTTLPIENIKDIQFDGKSLVINNTLSKQKSFVFKGDGFFSLKAPVNDNGLNTYTSSIKLINHPKEESEQYSNKYGYRNYNYDQKLNSNYVIDSYVDSWTSMYDSSSDCGGLSQTTYGFPATGVLDNLYIKDIDIKLNFLNYANPKELIIWLDVISTSGSSASIDLMQYRPAGNYSANSLLNTYNDAINSSSTRIYLLNQEHITNYEPNFSITFSDNADKNHSTTPQKSTLTNQYRGIIPTSNNSTINPTLYTSGYNDIDSELYIADIKNNQINNINCSLLKLKGMPLKDIVFNLNIGFVNPIEYPNKIMDNLLINNLILTGEKTEKSSQSNTISNSLCSWEIKVNTTNTNKFYSTDVLGKINYADYVYSGIDQAAISGYNFIGDFKNNPYLIPSVHINAPYDYLADINMCSYDDINGGKNWSSMRPSANENMRTISLAAIGYTLAGMAVLGGAGTGGAVGALMGIYALQALYERGGRNDPIINFFIETKLLNQTDAQDSQFYKPVYSSKFFGVPDKAIVCISQDQNYWYTMEVPIFNMFNSFAIKKQEYNYIKLYGDNTPGISNFEYTTIRNYTDLDLTPIVYTYISNIESLSGEKDGFLEGDMILLAGQQASNQNGYYIINKNTWIKVPSITSSHFLRYNNISNLFTESSLKDQKHILINGSRAYHFFDKNENITLTTPNGASNATISDKSYIQTSSGVKTVLTLNISVAKDGTISKDINNANVLWLYKNNFAYSDSQAFNKWLLTKTKNDKAENNNPLNFTSTYGEGSINSGSDILDPDILYKLSFRHSELLGTNELLNNEANDKYKFNEVFLTGPVSVPNPSQPAPPGPDDGASPGTSAPATITISTGINISFSDSDTGTSLLKGYSSTLENFLSKPLSDIAINLAGTNESYRLANNVFDNDWSDKQFMEIKSDKFKGSDTIPLMGSLHIENDFKKIMPIYLSSGDLSTINSRLDSLSNDIIPGLYSVYYSLSQDPTSCYTDYNDSTCPKTAAYQQIKIKEAEKTELEGALSLPMSEDGYIPYVSGKTSSATDGSVKVEYEINPYLYWIHIDPEQQCNLNDELSVKVLEKIRMRAIPISEVNNEGITPGSDSHIVPPTIFHGIPMGDHNASGVYMNTEGSVYSYMMGSGTIANSKLEWSSGINWDITSNFTYGSLSDSGDSKKLMISRLDSSKDMVVITEENYLRPNGIVRSGKAKDIIDFTNKAPIYLKFRNIPRKLKSVDSEDFERYIYDRNGNLIKSSRPASSVGQIANNFTCWHCVDSSGNFTSLPPYYQAANEMRYRAFFGSSDGIENKNTLFLDTKEDWEWIPYEYYSPTATQSVEQATIDFLKSVQDMNKADTDLLKNNHFSIMNFNLEDTSIQQENNEDDDQAYLLYSLNYEKYFQIKYRFQIEYQLVSTYYTGFYTWNYELKQAEPQLKTTLSKKTTTIVIAPDKKEAQQKLIDSLSSQLDFSKISSTSGEILIRTYPTSIVVTDLPRLPTDVRYEYVHKSPFPPNPLDADQDKLTVDRFIDRFEHIYFRDTTDILGHKYVFRVTILSDGRYSLYRYYGDQWIQMDNPFTKSINYSGIYEAARAPMIPLMKRIKEVEESISDENTRTFVLDSIDREILQIENNWAGGSTLYYKMLYEALGGEIRPLPALSEIFETLPNNEIMGQVGAFIILKPAWFEEIDFSYDYSGIERYPKVQRGDYSHISKFISASEYLWNSTKDLASINQRITRVTQGLKLPPKEVID